MDDVTHLLVQIDRGDLQASEQLLPLVYDQLRSLAAAKLRDEKPGQTLQATALVHEAYLRLVVGHETQSWNGRGHFFGAAAEAMRRILVERARRKKSEKHGGALDRIEFSDGDLISRHQPDQILQLNDSVDELACEDPQAAELVKLRVFADFSVEEAGQILGLSRATAYRVWTFARAWLKDRMLEDEPNQ